MTRARLVFVVAMSFLALWTGLLPAQPVVEECSTPSLTISNSLPVVDVISIGNDVAIADVNVLVDLLLSLRGVRNVQLSIWYAPESLSDCAFNISLRIFSK